ncbi:hypothetical protein ACFS5J_05100 [Flavobacterium chuncheonense]|uniref:Uncharacterized protein n=1 Tax=Flavobacterium chuncheonense TaxID=2026653 RepID=A0ABW5YLE8_9FLAO
MKKISFFILAFLLPFFGFSQEDEGMDMEQNLKELIDGIVKDNTVFQNHKLTFYLNGEELKEVSDTKINLNDLRITVKKKEIEKDGKKEDEFEINIKTKPFTYM